MTHEPWRGYVNLATYGASLSKPADDTAITSLADEAVGEWQTRYSLDDFYHGIQEALDSGEQLSLPRFGHHDEGLVRDYLTRFLRELDRRRPWPVPPYRERLAADSVEIPDAKRIGYLPLSQSEFRRRSSIILRNQPTGVDYVAVAMTLRTGEEVLLRASADFAQPGIELFAATDPGQTLAHFEELLDLEVEPL